MRRQKFWFHGLTDGVNQATDPLLTESPQLLKNISFDQRGNYTTRKGSSLIGSKLGTDQGYGLFSYIANNGSRTLMAVTERDLYAYNEGTSSWGAAVDTDEWPASKRVDGINFLNRLYLGSEDGGTALAYSTGSSITDVVPSLGGSTLAVNKNVLALGGNSIKPDIVFYTNPYTQTFHSATGTCGADADTAGANTVTATTSIFEPDMEGAILYNTTDGEMNLITTYQSGTVVTTDTATSGWNNDTIYVLQNNFKLNGGITGMYSYDENFISFDNVNTMHVWDPTRNSGRGWSKSIPNISCVNYRSVQVVNGLVLFANRRGLWLYAGDVRATDISAKIRDKVNGYGYWDLIQGSSWGEIAAGSIEAEGKYFLSVGTFSTVSGAPASAEDNVVLMFNVKTGNWSHYTFPDQPVAFATFVDTNGNDGLYFIGKDNAGIWQMETGTTDDDAAGNATAISCQVRTADHYFFKDPTQTTKVLEYLVKYSSSTAITVKATTDHGSYSTIVTLPSTSGSTTVRAIRPIANMEGITHSLDFTWSGVVTLEGYGFKVTQHETTRLPYV